MTAKNQMDYLNTLKLLPLSKVYYRFEVAIGYSMCQDLYHQLRKTL